MDKRLLVPLPLMQKAQGPGTEHSQKGEQEESPPADQKGGQSVFTVTRQCQWPDGTLIVEISAGGLDYCNPDAMRKKYSGELEEYLDPREAVTAAIQIAHSWQIDVAGSEEGLPEEPTQVFIGRGATGGMTMPFDPEPLTEETFTDLRKWAEERYKKLEKCSECGDILPEERWTNPDLLWGEEFCSEFCCAKAAEAVLEEDAVFAVADTNAEEHETEEGGSRAEQIVSLLYELIREMEGYSLFRLGEAEQRRKVLAQTRGGRGSLEEIHALSWEIIYQLDQLRRGGGDEIR